MSAIRIVAVQTAQHKRQFLELPARLHGHDPKFAPALAWDESRLLGFTSGHPFPEENEVQAWIAVRDEVPVGRIAAINPRQQCLDSEESCTHFGFFAAENDLDVARSLLRAAAWWASQRGHEVVRGPFSPSINYTVGLMQDGFEAEPSFQVPNNPGYYAALLEAAGLKSIQDLFALELSREQMPLTTPRLERVAARLTERYGVKFRKLNKWKLDSELDLFLKIAQQSLQHHWGFVPLSEREHQQLKRDLSWIVDSDLLHFAEVDGVAVGAALALPDLAPCLQRIQGRLFPFGFLKLWWAKKHAKRFRVVATNVLPQYNRLGIGPALISRIARHALKSDASIEFSWIAQSNPTSFQTIENGGAKRTKTFRVYEANCNELLDRRLSLRESSECTRVPPILSATVAKV